MPHSFGNPPKFGSPYGFSNNICNWINENLHIQEQELHNIASENHQSVLDMGLPIEEIYLENFKHRTIDVFGENWREEFKDQINKCIEDILRGNSADSIFSTQKLKNMGFDMSRFQGGYKKKKKKKSTNKKNNIKKVKKRKTKKKYTKKRKA